MAHGGVNQPPEPKARLFLAPAPRNQVGLDQAEGPAGIGNRSGQ